LGLFFPHLIAVGGEFVKHIDGDDVKCKLEESQELPAISFAVNTYEKSDRLNGAVFLKSNLVFEFFYEYFPDMVIVNEFNKHIDTLGYIW
jgi:hypothetical protein